MVCAVDQNLEMQVRAGRVAPVADCRDLIAGHYALTDLHSPGVDVAVRVTVPSAWRSFYHAP